MLQRKWTLGILAICGMILVMIALFLGLTGSAHLLAQPAARPMSEDRTADTAAIRARAASLSKAFGDGNASEFVANLASGAELIPDDAPPLRGRDAILKACTAFFANRAKQVVTLQSESLRFISRDTAVEEGQMKITEDDDTSTQRYSLLYVKEDGKWLVGVIREWPAEDEELHDLDWLIGTWEAKRSDVEVKTTYEWIGDKAFLRGTIKVREKDASFTGIQLIAYDPRIQGLHVWLFGFDGSMAEGTCTRDGNTWQFQTEGVQPDGTPLAATNILVRVNKDTFTWQPVDLTLGDTQIGSLPPVKVVRSKVN